jgi:hypothetical protein
MKTYGDGGIAPRVLEGGELSASRPGHFTLGERAPGIYWIGGWVGRPRADMDAVVKRKVPSPRRESNPNNPSRSQSLHWLKCPGSSLNVSHIEKYFEQRGKRNYIYVTTCQQIFSAMNHFRGNWLHCKYWYGPNLNFPNNLQCILPCTEFHPNPFRTSVMKHADGMRDGYNIPIKLSFYVLCENNESWTQPFLWTWTGTHELDKKIWKVS